MARQNPSKPQPSSQPPSGISIATCFESYSCGKLNPQAGGKHFSGLITGRPGQRPVIAPHSLSIKDKVGFTVEFRAPGDRPLTEREQDTLEAELNALLKEHNVTPFHSSTMLAVDAFVESERARGPLHPTVNKEFNEAAARLLGQSTRGNRFDIEYHVGPEQLPELVNAIAAIHKVAQRRGQSRGRGAA